MAWFIFGLTSTVFIGTHLVASKKILVFEDALKFLTVLATAQFVILFPIIPLIEIPDLEPFLMIIFQSIILTSGLLLQFNVLRKLPISTVAPLNNLMPLFLFSYAFFILGETLDQFQIVGLVILVAGAYLVEFSVKDFLTPLKKMLTSKMEQYLIIAVMVLAGVAMMDKLILSYQVSVLSLLFFSQLFLAGFSLLALFFIEGKEGVKKAYQTKGLWVLFTALLKTIGNLAYLKAVSLTYVSLVMPLRQLSSFFAALVGGKIFKEKFILRKSIACIIMILGILLIIQ